MPEIVNLRSPSAQEKAQLREIFFESSTKRDFKDAAEKDAFYHKYLGLYLERFEEFVWVARDQKKILGYMVGSPVTLDPELYRIQPHLHVFESYLESYPAHLHVNFHSDARGLGLGSKLFSELEKQLQVLKIKGVHIMTGPDSRNKSFYLRLGFSFEVTLSYQGSSILLMGKSL